MTEWAPSTTSTASRCSTKPVIRGSVSPGDRMEAFFEKYGLFRTPDGRRFRRDLGCGLYLSMTHRDESRAPRTPREPVILGVYSIEGQRLIASIEGTTGIAAMQAMLEGKWDTHGFRRHGAA